MKKLAEILFYGCSVGYIVSGIIMVSKPESANNVTLIASFVIGFVAIGFGTIANITKR